MLTQPTELVPTQRGLPRGLNRIVLHTRIDLDEPRAYHHAHADCRQLSGWIDSSSTSEDLKGRCLLANIHLEFVDPSSPSVRRVPYVDLKLIHLIGVEVPVVYLII
jgi:hypothetical protein